MNGDGRTLTRKRKWVGTASEDEDLSYSQNLNSTRGVYSRKRVDSSFSAFPDIRNFGKPSEKESMTMSDRVGIGCYEAEWMVCTEVHRLRLVSEETEVVYRDLSQTIQAVKERY